MIIKIFCDGGSRGNPGPAACAFIVFEDDKQIDKKGKFLGASTNNFAEYSAVLLAIEYLIENKKQKENIHFFLDSQLVVNQLNGIYKIKEKTLIPFVQKIKTLEKVFINKFLYTHIPREKNKAADLLVNEVLDSSLNN